MVELFKLKGRFDEDAGEVKEAYKLKIFRTHAKG